MKKLLIAAATLLTIPSYANVDCGDGWVVASSKSGSQTHQCEKLWCIDLETGKSMGSGNSANSGYIMGSNPNSISAYGKSVTCWGERKWCSGAGNGDWSDEMGAYIRNGGTAYETQLSGGCWKWDLTKPKCPSGTVAILQDNEWACGRESATVTTKTPPRAVTKR